MAEVLLLAGPPGWLGSDIGVAESKDEYRHVIAEFLSDELQRGLPALVLYRIVQQPGDGLILGPTVLEYQCRHGQ
jgi:hypothetical protein